LQTTRREPDGVFNIQRLHIRRFAVDRGGIFLTALKGTERVTRTFGERMGKGQAICEWRRMMLKESTTANIHEIVVSATEEALNAAIAERGIQPDKIISVIYEPRRELAIGDYGAKYRVIYRS
jgi:hypothetical protein